MKTSQFYELLDELLELQPGTLKGPEQLSGIPKWDSLATIGFIALLDQHFGVNVAAVRIADCKTPADLAALLGDRLSS